MVALSDSHRVRAQILLRGSEFLNAHSRSETRGILAGSNKGFDHLGVDEVAVELV